MCKDYAFSSTWGRALSEGMDASAGGVCAVHFVHSLYLSDGSLEPT